MAGESIARKSNIAGTGIGTMSVSTLSIGATGICSFTFIHIWIEKIIAQQIIIAKQTVHIHCKGVAV